MAFHVRHRFGANEANPPAESFAALLDEVDEDPTEQEHIGVGVVHESGWAIGVYPGWHLTLENVDELDIEPRHLDAGNDRELVLRLMRAVADGDRATLEAQPWRPGYGPSRA